MRPSIFLLVTIFMAFPVWMPMGVSQTLLPQDDAGQGSDAPNSFEKGWKLDLGTYTGELAGVPFTQGIQHSLIDQEDWYRFHIQKDRRVTVVIQGQPLDHPVPDYHVMIRLVDPRQALAGVEAINQNGLQTQFDVVAQSTGWWGIHLWTAGGGGGYRFTISTSDPPAFHLGGTGGGLHVFHYRVAPGGSFQGLCQLFLVPLEWDPLAGFLFQVRLDDGQVVGAFGSLADGPIVETATNAQVLGQSAAVGVPVDRRGGSFLGQFPFDAAEPGDYALVAILPSAESAIDCRALVMEGETQLLGKRDEPVNDLILLRHSDFHGDVGLSNSLVTVSRGLSAEVPVEHDLFGAYLCNSGADAQCRIMRPDGAIENLVNDVKILDDPEPGLWTFTRDQETSVRALEGTQYLLIGADVDLDWARHGGGPPVRE